MNRYQKYREQNKEKVIKYRRQYYLKHRTDPKLWEIYLQKRRDKYIKTGFKQKKCKTCGKIFIPTNSLHARCGSIATKSGCSWDYNREYNLNLWLTKTYNINADQFREMFKKQKSKCAICKLEQPLKRLALDHDHKTGKLRALLCDKCNRGLGHFQDDINMLYYAIEYLKRFQ